MVKESDNLIKKQKKYFILIVVSVYEGQAIEYKLKKLSKFVHPDINDVNLKFIFGFIKKIIKCAEVAIAILKQS